MSVHIVTAQPEEAAGRLEGPASANILPFPGKFHYPAHPDSAHPESVEGVEGVEGQPGIFAELGQHGRYCSIFYVARALRLQAADLRTVAAHVRAHIKHNQFPAPVNSRLRRGKPLTGADLVSPKSEWLRAAVDAWITRQLTPEQRRADAADRARHIDAALDARFGGGRGA